MDIRAQIESLEANGQLDSADTMEKLLTALESIAANTCCDTCQEAALVARNALSDR